MPIYRLLAAACLLPSLAMAQTAGDAVDARAKVQPPAYRSAFESFRPMTEDEETPDKKWLASGRDHAEQSAGMMHHAHASAMAADDHVQPSEPPAQATEGNSHAH